MNKFAIIGILSALMLACGVSAPVLQTSAELPKTATATAILLVSPTAEKAETVEVVTETYIHVCKSLDCKVVGTIPAGDIQALCTDSWCTIPAYGYFCRPAAEGRGGCGTNYLFTH